MAQTLPKMKGLCLRFGAALCVLAAARLLGADSERATNANPAAALPPLPNIILILADDLGYGDLGSYGQARIKTPHLDRLAAEGMRFRQFYAGSTVCAPSRCALMTGRHTGHARIRGNAKVPLLAEDVTLAEVLKQAGYRTGLIGKWGLGDQGTPGLPHKQGFDEFVGYLDQTHAHDYYTHFLWRYDFRRAASTEQTEDLAVALCRQPMIFPENYSGRKGVYMHDVFTTAALNYLRLNQPDPLNQFRPFFLFLSYTIPHANNEEGARTGNGMQVPSLAPYENEPWPAPEKGKAAMITRMDRDIGQILERLKSVGHEDNTLILFTSDNGPHKEGGVDPKFFRSSGPLRGLKRDLYEGGIRVPMIVHWPARIKPGVVSDQVWTTWDILPTLAEIARVEPPEDLDGLSFLPTLLGQEQTNQHAFLYWEFHEGGSKQAVRMGDWKAVRTELGKPLELYHLKQDIAEGNDVAEKNPDIIARIEEYLKSARSESAEWPLKPAPAKRQAPAQAGPS